uniref:Peptidase M20 dimerisation domain-containing protein n=1 Tax=Bionectria ochroleuca TaxID=29856 RepID=A0A8H7NGZ7_BIOOC
MANTPVVQLLRQLMEIPSVSEEEQKIGIFLSKYLENLGYTVEPIPIAPDSDRCNVYAYLGADRKARTCMTSHMDTVPPHIDFKIEGDIIYGRGACDDKGPLAAQIIAAEELRAERVIQDGDISLLFVVGEEKGGPGMLAANDMNLNWEAIIHSGYPEKGKNAATTLVTLLDELKSLDLPTSELLGPTTFNLGKIQGGVAYNVLAADAYALCGIRVAANLEEIEKKVAEIVKKYPDVTLKKSFGYPETYLDYEIEGLDSMPVSFGTDIPRLKGNHKRYLYGPGSILHAHGVNEQVAIPDLIESVAVYKRLVLASLEKNAQY